MYYNIYIWKDIIVSNNSLISSLNKKQTKYYTIYREIFSTLPEGDFKTGQILCCQ